ncbi:MAG TPA: extensin family protein [Rhodoblastus sp.]|nr:extensin family protein [Rhodoblastus sp.]
MPELPEDPAACDALIATGAVVATRLPAISGEIGCGVAAPVSLDAVILPDKRSIPVEPHPVLRCDLAAEAAHWIAEDLIPSVEETGGRIRRLIGAGGYQCRSRNGSPGAPLSEHARGNALDLGGVEMADGHIIGLPDMAGLLEAATNVRAAACARFATVLGKPRACRSRTAPQRRPALRVGSAIGAA